MKLEKQDINIRVRLLKEDSPMFGEVGRLLGFESGEAVVLFDDPTAPGFDMPNPLCCAETDLERAGLHPWPDLYREIRRLQAALEQYGAHQGGPDGCQYQIAPDECTCGFNAALAGEEW